MDRAQRRYMGVAILGEARLILVAGDAERTTTLRPDNAALSSVKDLI